MGWRRPLFVLWNPGCLLRSHVCRSLLRWASLWICARGRSRLFLLMWRQISSGIEWGCLCRNFSLVILPAKHTQQSAELWGSCSAIRMERCFVWQFLFLLTHLRVVGWQLVHLRARTWLGKQLRLLRSIVTRFASGVWQWECIGYLRSFSRQTPQQVAHGGRFFEVACVR